ncbi:MAG: hypothetical protein JNL74_15740 [Fibrobacteres bacterium]|nr:hypothetical protein [Fibrobacterota bacterium]
MKLSPDEKAKIDRLLPSKFSAAGFLGTDTRPLEEIIADDLDVVAKSGVTTAELSALLKDIHTAARGAFGVGTVIVPGVTAVHYESRGKIPSPFRGDGVFEKGETVIEMADINLTISDLSIHLISRHSFFQGKGSPYRIEPANAVILYKKVKGIK